MKYTVVWKAAAFNELTELWLRSTDRAAVTSAVARVERLLARRPLDAGESREGNVRVTFEEPLVITFEHFEADRKVRILSVRLMRQGPLTL